MRIHALRSLTVIVSVATLSVTAVCAGPPGKNLAANRECLAADDDAGGDLPANAWVRRSPRPERPAPRFAW